MKRFILFIQNVAVVFLVLWLWIFVLVFIILICHSIDPVKAYKFSAVSGIYGASGLTITGIVIGLIVCIVDSIKRRIK